MSPCRTLRGESGEMCELLHTSLVVQKMQCGQKNPWNVRGPSSSPWASACCRTYCLFCSRSRAAYSREASKAASDNLSTKCSGLLLPSALSIWAARVRHLLSPASMPAFSVASGLSNSSDIRLRASSQPPTAFRAGTRAARGALEDVVPTSVPVAYCGVWTAGDRLCSWLVFCSQLEVRGRIPKLLCYLAAKSLRAIKVEPVQTYSGIRCASAMLSGDPLRTLYQWRNVIPKR